MGKRKPYRIQRVNQADVQGLCEDVREQRVVIGIDVAKEKMVAVVMDQGPAVLETVGWSHPSQTSEFVAFLVALRERAASVAVAMEPSGVYGDAVRWQLEKSGFEVFRVSPKRSHDSAEVYDGVPSRHDGKCAAIVAWLHVQGKSEAWPLKSERERTLKAALWRLELHAKQSRQNRGRLEALTARHWPEVTELLDLDTATLLELLGEFGSPAAVAAAAVRAKALMQRVGGSKLDPGKVDAIVDSARRTMGVPAIAEEVELIRAVAREARRNELEERAARRRVEDLAEAEGSTAEMQAVVGKTTAAVVVAGAGDPRSFDSPQALVKALGLNLRENSSGKKQNRGVHITKRGSGTARMHLYMAALRLIQSNAIVKAWYAKKVARDGDRTKINAVVALMRKLVLALWHVARGATFDAARLFDARRLDLPVPG